VVGRPVSCGQPVDYCKPKQASDAKKECAVDCSSDDAILLENKRMPRLLLTMRDDDRASVLLAVDPKLFLAHLFLLGWWLVVVEQKS